MKNLIKIKSAHLDSGSWKSYLPLAVGELILIALGIYLAFQAENWREELKEERELTEYLKNLSQTIEGDLLSTIKFRDKKSELTYLSEIYYTKLINDQLYKKEELTEISYLLRELLWERSGYLINTSAFDAIKNSGFLNQLHGQDLEKLIYGYYLTAEKLKYEITAYEETLDKLEYDLSLKYAGILLNKILGDPGSLEVEEAMKILNDRVALTILHFGATKLYSLIN